MKIFSATLSQMLFFFTCILIGLYIRKKDLIPENSTSTLSKLVSFIFVPALMINSFSNNCTINNLKNNLDLVLYGLIFVVIQILLAYLAVRFFTKDRALRGVYLYSLTVVNFSFMGNSLINNLYGSEMLFKYLMFTIPMNVFTFSFGVIWLTAGQKKFSFKMLINPIVVSMLIGMSIGLTGIKLPLFVSTTISSLAACFSPMAMLLTGFVIGGFDILELLKNKKIYVLTLWRCIILPFVLLTIIKNIGLPSNVILLCIFLSAMPLGLNTIVFPATYGGDTTPGASMAVISNIVGLVSVPAFLFLFA